MRENSTIKNNILKYAVHKGISKYEIYQKTGISRSVLSQKNGMTEDNILKFLAYYKEVSPEWLLTGSGAMIKEDTAVNSAYSQKDTPEQTVNNQLIPVYDMCKTAGLASLLSDTEKHTPVEHILLPNVGRADGGVYAFEDSMSPLIKAGDILVFRQMKEIPESILWGEMYLLSYDLEGEERITIRHIQPSEKEKHVRLVNPNTQSAFKDILVDKIRSLAHIKASIRFNTVRTALNAGLFIAAFKGLFIKLMPHVQASVASLHY